MAEATGLRNNALPYPIYGAPFGIVFPILDADGDLVTGATALDSEVSKNADTAADCTNEATEIATSSGLYYLLLTATELTADVVAGITKTSTSGAKTTSWALFPRKLVTIRSGTAAGGDTSYITLDSGASAVDDTYNGMVCIATIDSNVEARIIADYTGSNKQAAVTPAWNVAPDSDDTFVIKLPEGVQIPQADVSRWTAVMPDSIPADGTRPSPEQALYMIVQYLMERGIVGTTQTIYKADGTTPLLTQTLGDATNPTTITRAT